MSPTPGILDIPAPLLGWLDASADALPPALRLAAWGGVCAITSMSVYWLLSPQARIKRARHSAECARVMLARYEGEFNGLLRLAGRSLAASLRQLCLVAAPALLASVPLLSVLAWLSTTQAYVTPAPGSPVSIRVISASRTETRTLIWPDGARLVVPAAAGPIRVELPSARVVSAIHKRRWWNALIGNPSGYLPEHSNIERVELMLERREVVSFGPPWLRRWEFWFLTSLLLFSIGMKRLCRIE